MGASDTARRLYARWLEASMSRSLLSVRINRSWRALCDGWMCSLVAGPLGCDHRCGYRIFWVGCLNSGFVAAMGNLLGVRRQSERVPFPTAPSDATTDAAVITRSLAHPQVFATVFDRHYDAIHQYLARRGGLDLADDVAAQTFMVAFERRASFRAAAAPTARPWLFGIATNLLRNRRRAERRALSALAEVAASALVTGQNAAFPESGHLGDALASLDADQRDALLLYAWEGLRYEEIAVALGVPVGTVRSRLARARARLRAALEEDSTAAEDRNEVSR
jgi:RNA polymerase sigma factor (sigma-70 family)